MELQKPFMRSYSLDNEERNTEQEEDAEERFRSINKGLYEPGVRF